MENFQLIDNETIDNSITKRELLKLYHQQGAKLDKSDKKIEFIFGENINYHQIGNAYLQYEITVEKDAADPVDRILIVGDATTLEIIAFAYCSNEAKLSTTGGGDIEHKKFVGEVSKILRFLASKDGDLVSHFDKIDESEAQIGNKTSTN